jgi:Tol biopolymer transport system component
MTTDFDHLTAALADRYTIQRELGRGGMATVYLAEDRKHHREVAIKVLKPELAAVLGAERFVQEIQTTAQLQHPHILPLFDSGEADGFLFYVMPYVEGETLRAKLNRETQLAVDEAVQIATDVADALQYAHAHGVIHRDIKPENILLHDGRPIVADFGIALAVGAAAGPRLTETGVGIGTQYYMSPEQATGDKTVGPASDIFALACVLYEMLVGEPPYMGSTVQAVLGRIIEGSLVTAATRRASVPANVDAAIRRALEMLPADRFTSAGGFAAALEDTAFRYGDEVAGVAPAVARLKRALVGVGAVAVLLGVVAAWALLRPAPPPKVSRYGLAFAPGQEPLDMFTPTFALAPDHSFIAYVGPAGGGSQGTAGRQLWIKRRDRLQATPLEGTEGAQVPAVSPDGRWIVYVAGGQLRKIPVGGGASVTLADSAVGERPAWLDDGTIVYTAGGWRLARLPAEGGTADIVWTPPAGNYAGGPMPVVGARGFLFEVCDWFCRGADDYWVMNLRTGKAHLLVKGAAWAAYASTGDLVYVQPDGRMYAAPFDAKALKITGNFVPVLDSVKVDVSDGPSPDVDLAADGTLLMMTGVPLGGEAEFVWVTRAGVATPVDSGETFDLRGLHPAWALSPDGTRLAFRQRTKVGDDIWVEDLRRGSLSRLTTYEGVDEAPRWSPDGTHVTFLSERTGSSAVWTKRADGVGDAELLFDARRRLAQAYWTPDGKWLVLNTRATTPKEHRPDILTVRPGRDSVARPLVASNVRRFASAVSPDSHWIAYETLKTGRPEIVVRPFPDVKGGRVPISSGGGWGPLWAHNGHELFYVNAKVDLVSVDVQTGQQFRVGDSRVLFHLGAEYLDLLYTYDITPDDQRFLFARHAETGAKGAAQWILVENWTQELKAKMGS